MEEVLGGNLAYNCVNSSSEGVKRGSGRVAHKRTI